MYLLSERTQLLGHYALIGHLQHVSAVLAIIRCNHIIHGMVCIMLRLISHQFHSRFYYPNNIWWGAQILPLFCYLVPFRPRYSLTVFCNINKVPDLVTSPYFYVYIVKVVFHSQEHNYFPYHTMKCV
jgi:hypothetical protein